MMRAARDRANDYREKLEAEPDGGLVVRRVSRVIVPRRDSRGTLRSERRRAEAGAIFEDELAEAVEDFADMRADGADTTELADYIGYLADVVAALADGDGAARRCPRAARRARAWEAIASSVARRKHRID